MSFLHQTRRRPPDEDDEPKVPRPPGTKEPEPDVPEPDDETRDLVRPVQTRVLGVGWSFQPTP
jgi:hypothetical protein